MENLDSVVGICVWLNFEMELRDGLLEQKFGQCDRCVCVCEIEEEFLRSWATLSLSHTSLKLPKSPHNSYHC